MQVMAFRTALLAWALGVLSALVGSVPLLLLGAALCAVSLGAVLADVVDGWS